MADNARDGNRLMETMAAHVQRTAAAQRFHQLVAQYFSCTPTPAVLPRLLQCMLVTTGFLYSSSCCCCDYVTTCTSDCTAVAVHQHDCLQHTLHIMIPIYIWQIQRVACCLPLGKPETHECNSLKQFLRQGPSAILVHRLDYCSDIPSRAVDASYLACEILVFEKRDLLVLRCAYHFGVTKKPHRPLHHVLPHSKLVLVECCRALGRCECDVVALIDVGGFNK